MHCIVRLFLICSCCLIGLSASAQRGLKKQAEKFFEAGKYLEAYESYNRVEQDRDVLMYKGIAAHHIGKIEESQSALISSYSQGNKDKRLFLYVGDNYLLQGQYQEAARFYKSYLQYVDKGSAERNKTIHKIKRCGFAKDYKYVDQQAFVENLGEAVNSVYDEISALQSPSNPNKYYFSSNRNGSTGGMRLADGSKDEILGEYSADMYAVESQNGTWTGINGINPILNTAKNDIIQDFSRGGEILYYLKTSEIGDVAILTDTFRGDTEEIIFPKPMISPIVAELGDKDLRVFDDSTYLFASMRSGGYGGYDLYLIINGVNGWTEPINLGPNINSNFDEVSPYITNNGTRLYFSSNRLDGIGGFDVFESVFGLETGKWNKPQNVGAPINSPADDKYFRVSQDGLTGILSSNRLGTLGGYDLYMIYLKNQVTDQLDPLRRVPFLDIRNQKQLEKELASIDTNNTEVILEDPISSDPLAEETKDKEEQIIDYSGVESREVIVAPLYYQSSENIMSPANITQLNKVIEVMKIFPETKLEISGHAVREALEEFDLYFSIKRAEKAAEYISREGISANRIILKGAGSAYPAVNSGNAVLSNKYNRRLDLRMIYPPQIPLRVIYSRIPVPDASKDESINKYKNSLRGLSYKISLINTKQMYKNPIVRSEKDVMIEKNFDGSLYQYTTGLFDKYSDARATKSRLARNSEFANVEILVYIDGQRISAKDIDKYTGLYPDLVNFTRYEIGQ